MFWRGSGKPHPYENHVRPRSENRRTPKPESPKIPLAFLGPVRYTLEVSLHLGITNSRTALAQRIVPERPFEVLTGEIKQLER